MTSFPRISENVVRETFEELASMTESKVFRFGIEQPIVTNAIRLVSRSDEEFATRMESMYFLYTALQKQLSLGE